MTIKKDPDAVLDFSVDWSGWLAGDETITQSTWTVPEGLTQARPATRANGITTVWLSGGSAGETYRIANKIETSTGRTDERTLSIWAVER